MEQEETPTDEDMFEAFEAADYDVAQICLNGHLINDSVTTHGGNNQPFCDDCGAPTVVKCEKCGWFIRGARTGQLALYHPNYSVPAFCIFCGEPQPWTSAKLAAAKELADELDDLDEDEKALLKQSIDDIVRDSPKTTVAAARFKKLAVKGGKELAGGFRDILVDIVSETAKKILWP